ADATPVRSMTAERGLDAGTATEAGLIATSSAVSSTPSGPPRRSVNDAAETDGALTSRLKPTVIAAGNAGCVELGGGDNDVTRMAPEAGAPGSAPSVIHCRTTLMSLCGSGGKPAGIRSPTAAVPSSF